MSSAFNSAAFVADPSNDLFWRFDLRRLGAEEIHDAALLVSGELNSDLFGEGYFPQLPPEVLRTQSRPGEGWGSSSARERARRALYMHVKRSLLPPLLTAFDFPDVDATCEARFATTQPAQALVMLHGDFFNEQAGRLARRVAYEAGPSPRAQVAHTIRLTFNRTATVQEIDDGLELMERLMQDHDQTLDAALKIWCLTVLNLNEFVYVD